MFNGLTGKRKVDQVILVDTREQKNSHVEKAFKALGIPFDRSKLYVGDYTLVNDQSVCVDRKGGLQEVYSNTVQQHQRFRAECARAQQAGIRLIVLVEQDGIRSLEDVASWKNPRADRWDFINRMHSFGKMTDVRISPRRPVDSERLMNIMRSMQLKYGIEWQFTTHKDCGTRIARILGEVGIG